ncbi:ABC-type branched-subunit amino acid transport system substrate-binding protein [Antricoccus suffuscus]|uniref:ABC-type branched-subunit amino acid transport system substrate-binding protein n=1 Tax=Antricoccus suffuscus TaxID=1629062 RepID=A0A2T0ZJX5_9ACTN|nr:ABC transporter substrate-binding protein [Antricoccus suffuscus]PRZ36629.1 ABC-type branched-subunit amino acid transport system substrate-binding protein [Antricoccus suffuscus]
MRKLNFAIIGGALALTLTMSACSTKGGSSGEAKTGSGGVKTDFGITNKDITLGVMTDTSGVFKLLGIGITDGNQIWADEVNAAGGICGRQVKLEVRDNGYKADKAVTLYAGMKDDIAGMVQLLGSPILAALKSSITSDNMLSIPSSWASTNLDSPAVMMVGATYDVEIINGMSYLQKQGKIKDGEKIGHIYIDSEYGKGGLLGSQAYAKDHNMTVVPVAVAGTDSDMSSAVTSLKSQGVSAIVLTTTPAQMSSVATQMAAQGMADMPILGSNPTFDPVLLNTPAKDALAHFYRVSSIAPFSSDKPAAQKVAKAYEAKYTDAPNDGVDFGYASGLAYQTVLEKACKDKDMTRKGLVEASAKVKIDTQDLTAPLDFSKPGQPSTRSTYIEQVDPAAKGGLKIVDELNESKEAKNYKAPLQK